MLGDTRWRVRQKRVLIRYTFKNINESGTKCSTCKDYVLVDLVEEDMLIRKAINMPPSVMADKKNGSARDFYSNIFGHLLSNCHFNTKQYFCTFGVIIAFPLFFANLLMINRVVLKKVDGEFSMLFNIAWSLIPYFDIGKQSWSIYLTMWAHKCIEVSDFFF